MYTTGMEEGLAIGLMAFLGTYWIACLVIGVLLTVAMCMIYHKAGKPWWAYFIPIYSTIVLIQICGKPWWWLFLMLIPIANVIFSIILMVGFVKSFGKSGGHFWLLLFFTPIYLLHLAFSKKVQFVGNEEVAAAA